MDKQDEMLDALLTYIISQDLWEPSQSRLLALSGGVDSMVLAQLLLQAGIPFSAAHCNFRLRGQASEEDEAFVRTFCQGKGIRLHVTRFDTTALAQASGRSIEMEARQLRYQWFTNLQQAYGYQRVLTGHHASDVVETMLLNLVRGTGIEGLHGIRPKQGCLVRPLLFATKAEVLAYARQEGIRWREDHTNAEDLYARNLLRNQVVPLLRQLNPSLERTFAQNAQRIGGVEDAFFSDLGHLGAHCWSDRGRWRELALAPLLALSAAETRLYYLLKPYGFAYAQVRQLFTDLQASSRTFRSASHEVQTHRGKLLCYPLHAFSPPQSLPLPPAPFRLDGLEGELLSEAQALSLQQQGLMPWDALLEGNLQGLQLRPWQAGDRFGPSGMRGQKKVSDFLKDAHLPLALRQSQAVLCDGQGNICWVVGLRVSEQARWKGCGPALWLRQQPQD